MPEDEGVTRKRQATPSRVVRRTVCAMVMVAFAFSESGGVVAEGRSLPLISEDGPAGSLPHTDDGKDQRLYLEQRRIDGRLGSLNRQLEENERQRRLALPPSGTPGVPPSRSGADTTAERLRAERQSLQFRQQLLDRERRQQGFERGQGGYLRDRR